MLAKMRWLQQVRTIRICCKRRIQAVESKKNDCSELLQLPQNAGISRCRCRRSVSGNNTCGSRSNPRCRANPSSRSRVEFVARALCICWPVFAMGNMVQEKVGRERVFWQDKGRYIHLDGHPHVQLVCETSV